MLKIHKNSLLILALTSLVGSRAMFSFFNDPEGPNLLVVIGMAVILYSVSLAAYLSDAPATGFKKLSLAILIQIALVTSLYFLLR
jgi:hypothetical protein